MEDLIAENFVLLTKIVYSTSSDIILSYSLKGNIDVIIKSERRGEKLEGPKEKRQLEIKEIITFRNELQAYQTLLDISNIMDLTGI